MDVFIKAGNGNRTRDLRTTNATHYRLCYASQLPTFYAVTEKYIIINTLICQLLFSAASKYYDYINKIFDFFTFCAISCQYKRLTLYYSNNNNYCALSILYSTSDYMGDHYETDYYQPYTYRHHNFDESFDMLSCSMYCDKTQIYKYKRTGNHCHY